MPTIIFDKNAFKCKMDGSIKGKVLAFLEKLTESDANPSLHIEPMQQMADSRVRTGRVDKFWRAVLFKLEGDGESHYLFVGAWPHDDAIAKARSITLTINPINGQAMIRQAAAEGAVPVQSSVSAPGEAPVVDQAVSVPPVEVPHETTSAPAPAEPAGSWLEAKGYTADALVNELALPDDLVAKAIGATSEDGLVNLAEQEEGWLADVLMDLAVETSIKEIVERLDLGEKLVATGKSEDEQLLQALQTTTAQEKFTFIKNQAELKQVIESGDFGRWRVFLHPEQRRYATRTYNGSFRLTGAAGTGKTVVLVHRAKMLTDSKPDARVVLTTFTRNLADSLSESLASLDQRLVATDIGKPGVSVIGVDALVHRVLREAGGGVGQAVEMVLGHARTEIGGRTKNTAWMEAIEEAGAGLPRELANEAFFVAEYTTVVLPNRITTLEGYLRVRRPGRGVALNREKRRAVWEVIAAYRAQARVGGTIDFPEAAAIAAAWLDLAVTSGAPHYADHVLVDEGQDLSAPQWQFLRALVAEGANDLFIAEDAHQRIYGQRIVLSHYGIKTVGRSRRLTLNYRTTAQNLNAAIKTLEGAVYTSMEEDDDALSTKGYRSARFGPEPVFATVASQDEETKLAAEVLVRWLGQDGVEPETIAVLVHDQRSRNRMVDGLALYGVKVRGVDRDVPGPGQPLVMTMHRAKGLEFSKVVIAGHGAWPTQYKDNIATWDQSLQDDADLRERSLLYVAMTRARDELVVLSPA